MSQPLERHTKPSIRKLLGEAGYLIIAHPVQPPMDDQDWSMWERGKDRIWLVEQIGSAPELRDRHHTHIVIDPKTLGVRNPNIQNG